MKDLIKRLRPDRFEDIVALVALFRPGPLQSGMVDDFVDRKHGRAAVEYPHPALEPILKPTYGVILYQEQVMQIARELAGYTLGSADLLRQAMGKKKPEEMAKQREIFTQGAVTRGIAEEVATFIFDLMEKFAGYGFNKSHSTAYALVSYQTAWLKAHYPGAFMAAVLSSDMDNTDKVVAFIDECRNLSLAITPPSINVSGYRFGVDTTGQVIYGLGAVKGVGQAAIETIVAERGAAGDFANLYDLCRRIDLRKVNRRALEALIRAGALDCLADTRAGLSQRLPEALRLAEQRSENQSAGQEDMFGLDSPRASDVPAWSRSCVAEWDESQRLAEEKATLGLYLSGHPINRYREELANYSSGSLAEVLARSDTGTSRWPGRDAQQTLTVAGLVMEVRTKISARGGRIAFLALEDHTSRIEVRIFTQAYELFKHIIKEDVVLVIEGRLVYDDFSDSLRLNAERLMEIATAREIYARQLHLKLNRGDFSDGLAVQLETLLGRHGAGNCPVVIDYSGEDASAQLALDAAWNVRPSEELVDGLRDLVGSDRVLVEYGH
jgi:DNA polymerase-3 subunit alpha